MKIIKHIKRLFFPAKIGGFDNMPKGHQASEKELLIALKPCHCGGSSYSRGAFSDLAHCDSCGCLYFLDVLYPVAKHDIEKLSNNGSTIEKPNYPNP